MCNFICCGKSLPDGTVCIGSRNRDHEKKTSSYRFEGEDEPSNPLCCSRTGRIFVIQSTRPRKKTSFEIESGMELVHDSEHTSKTASTICCHPITRSAQCGHDLFVALRLCRAVVLEDSYEPSSMTFRMRYGFNAKNTCLEIFHVEKKSM